MDFHKSFATRAEILQAVKGQCVLCVFLRWNDLLGF